MIQANKPFKLKRKRQERVTKTDLLIPAEEPCSQNVDKKVLRGKSYEKVSLPKTGKPRYKG
jgi:hypothetical protein